MSSSNETRLAFIDKYLFHTPLLVAVTLMMQGFIAPKPLKFLLATAIGRVLTFSLSHCVFRRIPVLERVL